MKPLPSWRHELVSLAIMLGAFAGGAGIAGAAGAVNLGTALAFGQIGFAIALVYVLAKR